MTPKDAAAVLRQLVSELRALESIPGASTYRLSGEWNAMIGASPFQVDQDRHTVQTDRAANARYRQAWDTIASCTRLSVPFPPDGGISVKAMADVTEELLAKAAKVPAPAPTDPATGAPATSIATLAKRVPWWGWALAALALYFLFFGGSDRAQEQ